MIREGCFGFDGLKLVTDVMEQSDNETLDRPKYLDENPGSSFKCLVHFVASKRRKSARKEIILEGEHAYAR